MLRRDGNFPVDQRVKFWWRSGSGFGSRVPESVSGSSYT